MTEQPRTEAQIETQVVIVGGGPVGLTLAIDLGQRGVRCVLVEKRDGPAFLPKMERCNARSMEIYRRLGLSEAVRAAGSPASSSMDIGIIDDFSADPVLRFRYPSVEEARREIAAATDGSLPLEPYQVISQYTLEPLLLRHARDLPGLTVLPGHELTDVQQDDAGVTATVRSPRGVTAIRGQFLVGCDGGRSTVRKKLGFALEGDGGIAERNQVLFRSKELLRKSPGKPCRMYFFTNADRTVLTVQDDPTYLRVNTSFSGDDRETEQFLRDLLGLDVDIELLSTNSWKLHLLLADHFGDRRVFIAGDSARLVVPTGGLGLNTGIGDATDLAWKLAAAVENWAGPRLLPSYEAERRPVSARVIEASRYAHAGQRAWQSLLRPDMPSQLPEAAGVRRAAAYVAQTTQRRTHEMAGIELGYTYAGSPIVVERDDELDLPDVPEVYIPTARPGSRLPHLWLEPGKPLHDELDRTAYSLLVLTADGDSTPFESAFASLGAPLRTRRLPGDAFAYRYAAAAVLVRPDLHVAWRGTLSSADAGAIAARVTGH